LRLPPFGEAASTTAALRVNSVLPTPYSDFQSVREHSTAGAARLSRPKGRGFYHHRVESQPTSSTLFIPLERCNTLDFSSKGAASTGTAWGGNFLHQRLRSTALSKRSWSSA
jgi:hypothetical protein